MLRSARVLAASSGLVVAALLAGCGSAAADGPDGKVNLTFTAYGGAGQQAMIDVYQKPYTKEHPNVTFTNASPSDISQVRAQVLSKNVKWDVVSTAPGIASQNCGTLFEPLDLSDVKKSQLVDSAVGRCYLANWINANPIAYRTDAFPDSDRAPTSVEDFFDVRKFPGKRGLLTNLQNGILEYALLADGVAADKLYPLDVTRALRKLGTIRSHTLFAPNVGALQQAVAAKQVDMFVLPDSRLVPLLNSGTDLTIVWDKTVNTLNCFAVPKGSPHKEAARRFIESMVTLPRVDGISEALGVAPVNKAADPDLGVNERKVEVYGPANTGSMVMQNVDWYAKNFDKASKQLNDWLAG